jgi:hypothetical protein
MAVARRAPGGWHLAAPAPVGDVATLLDRLRAMADGPGEGGGAVLLGVDLPLGLPRGYAARHAREADFPAFLRGLATRPDFFRVAATLEEVSGERPFYPARGVAGMTRAAHAAALGLGSADHLHRAVDRATAERPAGAPPFWTLGANQSGKAALAGWRDLLLPALLTPAPPLLWPFDGDLAALGRAALDEMAPGGDVPGGPSPGGTAPDGGTVSAESPPGGRAPTGAGGRIVIAETYPAEAMRHLGLRMGGSKRRQTDRAALALKLLDVMARLEVAPDAAMRAAVAGGFGADAAGEDRLDCTLGVLCVLNVLALRRPAFVPDAPWIAGWEGWVLGQTALPAAWPYNIEFESV